MQVVDMLPDYRQMIQQMNMVDAFTAFKHYTDKYPKVFSALCNFLYMTDLESLRPMIENVNFNALLETAQHNRTAGLMNPIIKIAENAVSELGNNDDFTLYLGLEMGNIGGFSCDSSRQMVLVGTDKPLTLETINFLIPHEINHMVRTHALSEIDMFSFTERVISEGLASYFALKYNLQSFNIQGISNALFISESQAEILISSTNALLRELSPLFGQPLTNEHMQKYFMYSSSDQDLVLAGYYVGMLICHSLINRGYQIVSLTKSPAEMIWLDYLNLLS